MTDLLSPQTTPANRVLPHLRSELSRLLHRRLYLVLSLVLMAGIVLASATAFAKSSKDAEMPAEARAQYERELRNWDRNFESSHQEWEKCAATVPEGEVLDDYCWPEPDYERDKPRAEWFYADPRYRAVDNLPVVVIAVTMATAMLGFILGASSGGAEWSSRSMTLQLLWEPRRLRLLALKWAALALVSALTTLFMLAVALALAAMTTSLHGTWAGTDAAFAMDGRQLGSFWPELTMLGARGAVLVMIAATFGYAISMLVRNTGAALGTGFVYFAVVENAIRIAFMRFGAEQFMLTSNAGAFVFPGGLDVPGRMTTVQDPGGGSYETTVMVHLSNGRALLTLLVYLVVVGIPAAYSFTRRDVG